MLVFIYLKPRVKKEQSAPAHSPRKPSGLVRFYLRKLLRPLVAWTVKAIQRQDQLITRMPNDARRKGVWKSVRKGAQPPKGASVAGWPMEDVRRLAGGQPRRANLLIEYLHFFSINTGIFLPRICGLVAEEMR